MDDDDKLRWIPIDPKELPDKLRREIKATHEKYRQAEEELLQALAEDGLNLADYMPRQRKAPCPNCRTKTLHKILHAEGRGLIPNKPIPPPAGETLDFELTFETISCNGCGAISFAHSYVISRGFDNGADERYVDYYPSPTSREPPSWLSYGGSNSMNSELMDLCFEIYGALSAGQRRLAAMGIRALLEQVMVTKVGDQGAFSKNLDAFCDKGFVSLVQRDAISHVLEVGHATIHRRFAPKRSDLNTALDIVEGILAAIYVHPDAAADLSNRVPTRTPTGKVIPWRRARPDAVDKGED